MRLVVGSLARRKRNDVHFQQHIVPFRSSSSASSTSTTSPPPIDDDDDGPLPGYECCLNCRWVEKTKEDGSSRCRIRYFDIDAQFIENTSCSNFIPTKSGSKWQAFRLAKDKDGVECRSFPENTEQLAAKYYELYEKRLDPDNLTNIELFNDYSQVVAEIRQKKLAIFYYQPDSDPLWIEAQGVVKELFPTNHIQFLRLPLPEKTGQVVPFTFSQKKLFSGDVKPLIALSGFLPSRTYNLPVIKGPVYTSNFNLIFSLLDNNDSDSGSDSSNGKTAPYINITVTNRGVKEDMKQDGQVYKVVWKIPFFKGERPVIEDKVGAGRCSFCGKQSGTTTSSNSSRGGGTSTFPIHLDGQSLSFCNNVHYIKWWQIENGVLDAEE